MVYILYNIFIVINKVRNIIKDITIKNNIFINICMKGLTFLIKLNNHWKKFTVLILYTINYMTNYYIYIYIYCE